MSDSRRISALSLFILMMLLLAACQPAATPTPEIVKPTAIPPTEVPTETVEPTLTASPAPTLTETAQPSPSPVMIEPLLGTFDVYVGASAGEAGEQLIRWVDVGTGRTVTERSVLIKPESVNRAGERITYVTPADIPVRMNSAGDQEQLLYAAPVGPHDYYEFLPSANGRFYAWVWGVIADGSYAIGFAYQDGSIAGVIHSGQAEPGSQVNLLRTTNDGLSVFYDLIGPDVRPAAALGGVYEIHQLSVASGAESALAGEPACANRFCPAHISPDGAYLARGYAVFETSQPLIVYNLVSGNVLTRFAIPRELQGRVLSIGYPVFTPGGELVYVVELGPLGGETYELVFANIVTGEQKVIARFLSTLYTPLGWTANARAILMTRADAYEAWQIPLDGSAAPAQIAGMRFIATITVDALPD